MSRNTGLPTNAPTLPRLNTLQQSAQAIGINLGALPSHLAIIMDGNGRWAKKKGLARLLGHREGYKTLRRILLANWESNT